MATIISRVTQLVRANLNDLIDKAEDPELMIDQLIRDFSDAISEARSEVAVTIGNLRATEEDRNEAEANSVEWGQKAKTASRRADEAEDPVEQDRLNNLAKIALQKQLSFESQSTSLTLKVAGDTVVVDGLKSGLTKMELKLDTLRNKRQELVSRAKMAQAQSTVQRAVGVIDAADPTSELSRFEERIRQQESQVRGMAELEGESLDSQFASLEQDQQDIEVEQRLSELKQKTPA